uniref:Uncharacterized protein n=1 Tax=Chromera velia CCMP2878 TaxID=1169474 RepID=A0A0G4HGD9_9ALVE|eukprot:Cvel_27333.t1-p1 / transcript=Cvel_27333.t1 / gene=Cvel_27333 / organism=Chromera_velia_CCMP2878 / gene_product=hypothetical protein / transcript_product=hypothetical protein / location=Cvel_scaffold3392:5781-7799(-) / protein_length=123 / sequence_SO=supercontig / SO=protein_coding / is_pseudo=false
MEMVESARRAAEGGREEAESEMAYRLRKARKDWESERAQESDASAATVARLMQRLNALETQLAVSEETKAKELNFLESTLRKATNEKELAADAFERRIAASEEKAKQLELLLERQREEMLRNL